MASMNNMHKNRIKLASKKNTKKSSKNSNTRHKVNDQNKMQTYYLISSPLSEFDKSNHEFESIEGNINSQIIIMIVIVRHFKLEYCRFLIKFIFSRMMLCVREEKNKINLWWRRYAWMEVIFFFATEK